MNKLIIGGREFSSRLFVGTGKFSSNELMEKAIEASGSEMITVAMKRINMTQEATDDMLTHIDRNRVQFLPNIGSTQCRGGRTCGSIFQRMFRDRFR